MDNIRIGDVSSGATGNVHLRNTEAVANTVALKGSRVTSTSTGTHPGRPHDPTHESRRVESGRDLLDNNAVNVLMASIMSLGGIALASWFWDVPVSGIFA